MLFMLLLEPVLVQGINDLIRIISLAKAAIVTRQCAPKVLRFHVDVIT